MATIEKTVDLALGDGGWYIDCRVPTEGVERIALLVAFKDGCEFRVKSHIRLLFETVDQEIVFECSHGLEIRFTPEMMKQAIGKGQNRGT